MKRIILSVLAGGLTLLAFWLGGFDFNERGGKAVICYLFTLYAAGATYTLIHIPEPKKD